MYIDLTYYELLGLIQLIKLLSFFILNHFVIAVY